MSSEQDTPKTRMDVFSSVVREGADPVEAVKSLEGIDEADIDEMYHDNKKKADKEKWAKEKGKVGDTSKDAEKDD